MPKRKAPKRGPKLAVIKKRQDAMASSAPSVDLPALVAKLAVLTAQKKQTLELIESEERPIREQILLHCRTSGIERVGNDTHMVIRVCGEKVDFSQKNIEAVYGKAHLEEIRDDLKKAGCVKPFDFLQVREKKVKESATGEKELRDEIGKQFG